MASTIGIISLSSGTMGEDFVKHEVDLGIQRLKDFGLNPISVSYTHLDVYKRQHRYRLPTGPHPLLVP